MKDTLCSLPCSTLGNLINESIHSERDRAIMKRRLIDGLTFEQLAEEFNMSARQMKNIVPARTSEIKAHLAGLGGL